MATAYYDGSAIFGQAVKVQHVPNPSAQQINAFFGISGTQLVYGGTRGRAFFITGVLVGSDLSTLNAAEDTLLSYDDGLARDLVDPRGRTYSQVVFKGEFQPDAEGPRPLVGGAGWAIPYRAVFHGLV